MRASCFVPFEIKLIRRKILVELVKGNVRTASSVSVVGVKPFFKEDISFPRLNFLTFKDRGNNFAEFYPL